MAKDLNESLSGNSKKNVIQDSSIYVEGGMRVGDDIHNYYVQSSRLPSRLTEDEFKYLSENFEERDALLREMTKKFLSLNAREENYGIIVDLFGAQKDFELLRHFIDEFTVLNQDQFMVALNEIGKVLMKNWKLCLKRTHFVNMSDRKSSDEKLSTFLLEEIESELIHHRGAFLRFINRLLDKLSFNYSGKSSLKEISFGQSSYNIRQNQTAVFFTPFIYDIDKFLGRISSYKKSINKRGVKNVKMKILSFGSMEMYRSKLEKSGIEFFILDWLSKGISDYYNEDELKRKMSSIHSIESKIFKGGKRGEEYPLGYNRSEALYLFLNFGVPKNVFTIFWCKKNNLNLFNSFFQ